jgi:PAS domain S-box-containing protein
MEGVRQRKAIPGSGWRAGFLLALALTILAGITWLAGRQIAATVESDRWESHTYVVIQKLDRLLSALTDAETGQRGFLITGQAEYLEPYHAALGQIEQNLDLLKALTKDNPRQQQRLAQLEPLIRARQATLRTNIDLRATQGFEAASQSIAMGYGKQLMDQIRRQVTEAQEEEAQLLKQRIAVNQANARKTVHILIIGAALTYFLFLGAFVLLRREILVRRQMEADLRTTEVRYRRLFEAAHDGVLLLDTHSRRITGANPFITSLLGYSREELVGKELWQIGLLKDAEASRAAFGQLAREGHIRYEDLPLQTKTGETREVEFISNRYEENGHSVIQCNIRDITERKRLEAERAALLAREQRRAGELQRLNDCLRAKEEQLQAANRELNDFATIVSHDLRTPLRGVATLAKWLQSDYADKLDEEGRANLADMVKRVGWMDRMIEDILQYSRLGRTEERAEPVALAQLVPEVIENLRPPPEVQVRVAPGLPVVQGEPVRLRQLFQNLIGNAIKYGDKPQMEIRVDWADSGSVWEFSVTDNGPGIEERHFERIFKIFQTLAPKDKTDSTGVGLALVKRIVERPGGRVWVESRLGQGSAFHFTWPKRPWAGAAEMVERIAA